MTPWTIYWLTRLDAVRDAAAPALGLSLAIIIALVVFGACMRDSGETARGKTLHRAAARLSPVPALAALVLTFLPTLKEAAAIIVIPRIAASEELAGLGDDFVKLAREWLVELRPGGGK